PVISGEHLRITPFIDYQRDQLPIGIIVAYAGCAPSKPFIETPRLRGGNRRTDVDRRHPHRYQLLDNRLYQAATDPLPLVALAHIENIDLANGSITTCFIFARGMMALSRFLLCGLL